MSAEAPAHHEIIRPLKEIGGAVAQFLSAKIANLVVPENTFDDFIGTLDTEPTQPALDWTRRSSEDTARYYSDQFYPPVPDVAGGDVLPNIQLGEE